MKLIPNLKTVERVTSDALATATARGIGDMLDEAREFIRFYEWCKEIREEYVGAFFEGIIGVFLFRILPSRPEVDEWVWVLVGDLPSAYMAHPDCKDPPSTVDCYIGAMGDWVDAARAGTSVAELIPVDVPATPANAEMLSTRLTLLSDEVLPILRAKINTGGA